MAAVFISQKGSEGYLRDDGPKVIGWMTWLLAIYAYVAFLIDKAPTEKPENDLPLRGADRRHADGWFRAPAPDPRDPQRHRPRPAGHHRRHHLDHCRDHDPHPGAVLPEGLYNFQLGIMRWQARMFAYLASLVDPYPPFALDQGPQGASPASATEAAPPPPIPDEPAQP